MKRPKHREIYKPLVERERIAAVLAGEVERKAQAFKDEVMRLLVARAWRNEDGVEIGVVDNSGKNIQGNIEETLLRIGRLIQEEHPEELPTVVHEKLKKAACLMNPKFSREAEAIFDPVEKALEKIWGKVTKLEEDSEYLFSFKRGGALRNELHEALRLMMLSRPVEDEIMQFARIQENGVSQYLVTKEELDDQVAKLLVAGTSNAKLHMIRAEIHEKKKEKLLMAVGKDAAGEVSKRMLALIIGQLHLLYHVIAAQLIGLFDAQQFELGDTDAESMLTAMDTLDRCLTALNDIRRTKRVIPTLV